MSTSHVSSSSLSTEATSSNMADTVSTDGDERTVKSKLKRDASVLDHYDSPASKVAILDSIPENGKAEGEDTVQHPQHSLCLLTTELRVDSSNPHKEHAKESVDVSLKQEVTNFDRPSHITETGDMNQQPEPVAPAREVIVHQGSDSGFTDSESDESDPVDSDVDEEPQKCCEGSCERDAELERQISASKSASSSSDVNDSEDRSDQESLADSDLNSKRGEDGSEVEDRTPPQLPVNIYYSGSERWSDLGSQEGWSPKCHSDVDSQSDVFGSDLYETVSVSSGMEDTVSLAKLPGVGWRLAQQMKRNSQLYELLMSKWKQSLSWLNLHWPSSGGKMECTASQLYELLMSKWEQSLSWLNLHRPSSGGKKKYYLLAPELQTSNIFLHSL